MLDIAKDEEISWKKREKQKTRERQTTTKNIFLLLLFYREKFIALLLEDIFEKKSSYCYVCIAVFGVAGYWKRSNDILTQ